MATTQFLNDVEIDGDLNVTGTFDISGISTTGQLILESSQAAADAIHLNASDSAGGIDIDAGTGGVNVNANTTIQLDSGSAFRVNQNSGTNQFTVDTNNEDVEIRNSRLYLLGGTWPSGSPNINAGSQFDADTQTYTANTSASGHSFNSFGGSSGSTIEGDVATRTISDAAQVYIGGPPSAGTNAAITKPWSLKIDGNISLGGTAANWNSSGIAKGYGVAFDIDPINYTTSDNGTEGAYASTSLSNNGGDTVNASAGALTITDATNTYIGGAPNAGTDTTITNAWSLWTQNNTRMDGILDVRDATNATSSTTGSIITAGGVGIGKDLFVSDLITTGPIGAAEGGQVNFVHAGGTGSWKIDSFDDSGGSGDPVLRLFGTDKTDSNNQNFISTTHNGASNLTTTVGGDTTFSDSVAVSGGATLQSSGMASTTNIEVTDSSGDSQLIFNSNTTSWIQELDVSSDNFFFYNGTSTDNRIVFGNAGSKPQGSANLVTFLHDDSTTIPTDDSNIADTARCGTFRNNNDTANTGSVLSLRSRSTNPFIVDLIAKNTASNVGNFAIRQRLNGTPTYANVLTTDTSGNVTIEEDLSVDGNVTRWAKWEMTTASSTTDPVNFTSLGTLTTGGHGTAIASISTTTWTYDVAGDYLVNIMMNFQATGGGSDSAQLRWETTGGTVLAEADVWIFTSTQYHSGYITYIDNGVTASTGRNLHVTLSGTTYYGSKGTYVNITKL